MKKLLFAFLMFFMLTDKVCAGETEIYFSPSLACENNIVKSINKSQVRIDAAVYSINNEDIVKALIKAHHRGVKIRILTDKLQAGNKSSRVRELKEAGINIRVNSKHKIEHNKFSVFDNKSVVTGSYNWTEPASVKNSENCIFLIKDEKAVSQYAHRFQYLWQVNPKYKSEAWFNRKK